MEVEKLIYAMKNENCITYELSPNNGANCIQLIDKLKKHDFYLHNKIKGFVCTDSPLAKMKQNAGISCIKLQNALNKPFICTISLRDRNSLYLSGELLSLNEFDIRIFLAVSGDPLALGDQPQAKAVFEGGSTKALKLINNLNKGTDFNGKKLFTSPKEIYGLSVINSFSENDKFLKNKLKKKIKENAMAIITQPIYDINHSIKLHKWIQEINRDLNKDAVLIQGFFPVLKLKTANFLAKLPGVYMPQELIFTLEKAISKGEEEERKVALDFNIKLFKELYSLSPKIHFMNHNNVLDAKLFIDSL